MAGAPGRLIAVPQTPAAKASERSTGILRSSPAFHTASGGDWNPDQWLDEPGVLEEDFGDGEGEVHTFSIGIFAGATSSRRKDASRSTGSTA